MRVYITRLTALILVLSWTLGLAAGIENPPPAWQKRLESVPGVDLSPLKADEQKAITEGRGRIDVLLAQDPPEISELASEYGRLGNLYMIHGLYTSADACYANAMHLEPGHFPWAYYAAYLAQQNGNLQAALSGYRKAISLDPDYPPARYRLALVHLDLNQADAAYQLLLPLLNDSVYEAAANYGLGQYYVTQQDHAKAIEHFSRALELEPGASKIHYPLAMSLRAAGSTEQAKQHLKQFGNHELVIEDRLVDSLQALRNPASRHFTTAMTAVIKKDYATAVDEFSRGMEYEPDNIAARTSFARVLYLNGNKDRSRIQLEQVISKDPDKVLAVFLLALLDDESGNEEQASQLYRRVVELAPAHEGANFFLGNFYLQRKEYAKAIPHYDAAIRANEKNLAAMLFRLAAMMGNNSPDRDLLDAANSISERAPNMASMRRIQILILSLSKDDGIRDTESAMKRADQMQQNQNHPVNMELLAIAIAAAGNFDKAAKQMRAAVTVEKQYGNTPNLPRMENTLSLLEKGELPALSWQQEISHMRPRPTNALATFRDYPDANPI
jgi:tetratricopeptide (TPR) repeat protein